MLKKTIFGVELHRPTSGRATALAVLYAAGLVFLLYWTQFWGFEVNLAAKVLLSVSVLWAYVTSLFGVRVADGWRAWVIYLAGLVAFNGIACAVLLCNT
ncbi:hypothetical protein [Burkholderia sp. MBR-1]|uniref:hypothetical protein n=1 Tax=Burkholderia sp. MBR-1 TaxID=2732364 RepID=UPI0015EEB082|nr:hypothetical protein [Burkholderia sp. MBR-1]QMI49930.1 hypothetical protein MBR110_31220 [Burkholderia sp. MBR-1]